MSSLIWKELRENLKWALLAAIVLGLAEIHALYQSDQAYVDYHYNSGITLCKSEFLTMTTFGCAVVGFLLGLVQILPELKRDRWAALLHRPVSHGAILRAKVAAGLLLYLVATVPSFLFCVWLAATPGHFPVPFVPGMVLPGTADICAGLVYYFAALAAALQRGGWLGVRVLLPLAAVHASEFILHTTYFYVAVEAAVLMALAFFAAAWGIIQHQDLLRGRPWLGKAAYIAVLFYAVCGVADLVKPFLLGLIPPAHTPYVSYQLFDDGRPYITTEVDNIVVSAKDLDGKPLQGDAYKPDRIRNHFDYLNIFSSYVGDAHGWKSYAYPLDYRESRSYLWSNGTYMSPRFEQWFYLMGSRTLVGFLPYQKTEFAQLGRDGFAPPFTPIAGFPSDTQLRYLNPTAYQISNPHDLCFAYLAKREIVNVILPESGPIFGTGTASASDGHASASITGVTLTHGIAIYNDKATLLTVIPYHRDMDRWGQLSLGINGTLDRYYLWYKPSAWIDGKTRKTMPSYLEQMTAQGEVLQTYTLPPLPEIPRPDSWDNYLSERLQSPAFFFGLMLYRKIGAALGSQRLQGDLNWQWDHSRRLAQEICLWSPAVSLILAGFTLAWARRVHFSWCRAWAWTAFVFAFHLPGFITFRLAADWPCQIPCPRCGKKRPTEDEHCPHCGKDWPAPPSNNAEIIESAPDERLTATPV